MVIFSSINAYINIQSFSPFRNHIKWNRPSLQYVYMPVCFMSTKIVCTRQSEPHQISTKIPSFGIYSWFLLNHTDVKIKRSSNMVK